ncbi:unnamed protein product [Pylaiella littoralis]
MSGKTAVGAGAGAGAGARRAAAKKGLPKKNDDDIISVEETVWTLRMGARDPPCNVARFEEIWVGKGDNRRKVARPPFDDPSVFSKPAYMYREQEAEEHSEASAGRKITSDGWLRFFFCDEDYEGPSKFDAFDRPAFKRKSIKSRSIKWALEDSKDYSKGGGIKYLGDKITQQMSRYSTFKVDPDRTQTIEVTPMDEWWQFKKAVRDEGKMMSVKEAEELMKKQDGFLGSLSLANKVLGQRSLEAAATSRYGHLDREDTQVLKEAGVKLGGPEDGLGLDGLGNRSGSDDDFGAEQDGGVDSEAGGEDDDFGDEVRSDDEEEVANDDANEGGGTLHQDDEDLNDSEDDGRLTDDEHHELQKLSRSVNAEGEEEEDDNAVNGDPVRASPTLSTAGHPAPDGGAAAGGGGGGGAGGAGDTSPAGAASGKRGASAMEEGGAAGQGAGAGGQAAAAAEASSGGGSSGGGGSSKRAKKGQKKGSLEINQANVVATLKRFGGRLASKALLKHFVAALKVDKKKNKGGLALLREILKKVATKVDDAMEGTVYVLKKHFS